MKMLHLLLSQNGVSMVHGHTFHFMDEPQLRSHPHSPSIPHIRVEVLKNPSLISAYTLLRPWVPLSGREGRYFSKTDFEDADACFSWGLEIKNVLTLIWLPEEQTIVYLEKKDYTPELLQFWLYHTFFPMVLELQRFAHMLHVGAVEVQNQPILFSAPSSGGKSTLTDFFIQKGHTLLSDDALGIQKNENNYYAIPAYPFHRPYREPETLGNPAQNFAAETKPLAAVFLLNKVDAHANISITTLTGIEKFKAMNSSSFIEFPFRKQERFTFFAEMSKTISVYRIDIPWDMNRLEEVYNEIIKIIS